MQKWNPNTFAGRLPAFGDEATQFHHLKMQYEASSKTATGWVDDKKIGSIEVPMWGSLTYWMGANTDSLEAPIDMTFKNFSAKPPPVQ